MPRPTGLEEDAKLDVEAGAGCVGLRTRLGEREGWREDCFEEDGECLDGCLGEGWVERREDGAPMAERRAKWLPPCSWPWLWLWLPERLWLWLLL